MNREIGRSGYRIIEGSSGRGSGADRGAGVRLGWSDDRM